MKRLLRTGWLLTPVLVVSLIVLSDLAVADEDAKALFEQRCSLCHATSKPLSKTKSSEEWRKLVTRMKGYASGRISDEEAEIIINYLSEVRGK